MPPMPNARRPSGRGTVPARAGAGLKPEHYAEIVETKPDLGFFEIHAENYMGAGGPPHAWLTRIRAIYPLSLHGVGLSIGGEGPLDAEHLNRLSELNHRYQPGLFSEHLAWSTHEGAYFNDLLPLPYDANTLARVVVHIDQVQTALGRTMLLENPASYAEFEASTMSEVDFLDGVAERTGCGLLLDVSNVYISGINNGRDPGAYLDAFPMEHVGEIHLSGYAEDEDGPGVPLLIDAHVAQVPDPVWPYYRRALARCGPVPTLIEWDNDVPDWAVLHADVRRADAALRRAARRSDHVRVA